MRFRHAAPRARTRPAWALLCACVAAGWPTPAGAVDAPASSAVVPIPAVTSTDEDLPRFGEQLPAAGSSFGADAGAGVESDGVALEPTAAAPAAAHAVPAAPAPPAAPQTLAQLRAEHARLVVARDVAQRRLLELEAVRNVAERRLDAALADYTAALTAAWDAGDTVRLNALAAAHDEVDPAARAALIASLPAADAVIPRQLDAARAAVAAAGEAADAARVEALAAGTSAAAAAELVRARQSGAERPSTKRAGGGSVDADLIFATGPIPGIGYWGSMAGGGLLDGWMGLAGAAVGGVGCTPPDNALRATGSVEQGEASWYGPGFDGQVAASGEVYDQTAMTAAHRTLPFGTMVRVYSSTTARCAFVRINDRGPFIDGRIIDLSRAAADAIGMESVAQVQLEVWAAPGAAPL